jgi:hypothetical protein
MFCDGTRLAMKWLYNFVTEARVITGHVAGQNVFTPRIE